MPLNTRTLFTAEPIEIKRDAAMGALEDAVARLRPSDLADTAMPAKLAERVLPRPPRLGGRIRYRLFEIEIDDDEPEARRWAAGLETTVRFYGAGDYFNLRTGAQPLRPPTGAVLGRRLSLIVVDPDGSDDLVERMDAQLETARRELEEQRRRCEGMRDALEAAAERLVSARRTRMTLLADAAGVLSARGWLVDGRKA